MIFVKEEKSVERRRRKIDLRVGFSF